MRVILNGKIGIDLYIVKKRLAKLDLAETDGLVYIDGKPIFSLVNETHELILYPSNQMNPYQVNKSNTYFLNSSTFTKN